MAEPLPEPEGEVDDQGSAVAWPEKGLLAKCWEARSLVREQLRAHKKLLLWPSAISTGVANQASLKLNRYIIADIIKIWSASCGEPQPPPVAWLRQEAWGCSKTVYK